MRQEMEGRIKLRVPMDQPHVIKLVQERIEAENARDDAELSEGKCEGEPVSSSILRMALMTPEGRMALRAAFLGAPHIDDVRRQAVEEVLRKVECGRITRRNALEIIMRNT